MTEKRLTPKDFRAVYSERVKREKRIIAEFRRLCIDGNSTQGDALAVISKAEGMHPNSVRNVLVRNGIIREWRQLWAQRVLEASR